MRSFQAWSRAVRQPTIITRLSTNYRPTILTRHQSKVLTAGHEIADVPVKASFPLAARSLLIDIAISGRRIPITLRGAITLTHVSCTIHGAVFNRSQSSNGKKTVFQLTIFFSYDSFFNWHFASRANLFCPNPDLQNICFLTRHFDTWCGEMASVSVDKDFIVSDIAHGFHLIKDVSLLSADFTDYGRAYNPAVKPALDRLLQNELRSHYIQAVP